MCRDVHSQRNYTGSICACGLCLGKVEAHKAAQKKVIEAYDPHKERAGGAKGEELNSN